MASDLGVRLQMRIFEKILLAVLLLSIFGVSYKSIDTIATVKEFEDLTESVLEGADDLYVKGKKLRAYIEEYGGLKEYNDRVNSKLYEWIESDVELQAVIKNNYRLIHKEFEEIILLNLVILAAHVFIILYLSLQLKRKPNKENSHG